MFIYKYIIPKQNKYQHINNIFFISYYLLGDTVGFHCFSKKIIYILIAIILLLFIIVISFLNILYHQSQNKLLHESSHGYINDENILYDFTNEKLKKDFIYETLAKYKDKKVIALTFDDGPSRYTPMLLNILKKHNVCSTFFLLSSKVDKNVDTIKQMSDDGHLIASHGYSHKIFTRLEDNEIVEEIKLSKDKIEKITNKPLKFIRVPFGIINDDVLSILNSFNLTSVLWHIDSTDWKLKNTQKITNKVVKKARNRRIILMHDTYKSSVLAVDKIIEKLKSDYSFVTVEELMILNTYSKLR